LLDTEQKVERGIVVFCSWAVFGFIGLGFLLEGGARDSLLTGLVGVAGLVAGFVAHMIINFVFAQPFSLGETALGLGLFALGVLGFIAGWLDGALSRTDFYIGLSLLAVLVVGFLIYVTTRHGVRGAFDRFDVTRAMQSERKE